MEVDSVRFYLMFNRPETTDSLFSVEDMKSAVNNILIGNVANFCKRVLTLMKKNGLV